MNISKLSINGCDIYIKNMSTETIGKLIKTQIFSSKLNKSPIDDEFLKISKRHLKEFHELPKTTSKGTKGYTETLLHNAKKSSTEKPKQTFFAEGVINPFHERIMKTVEEIKANGVYKK